MAEASNTGTNGTLSSSIITAVKIILQKEIGISKSDMV